MSRKGRGLFEMDDIETLIALRDLHVTLNLGFSSLILEGDFIEAIGSKEPNFKKGDVIIEIKVFFIVLRHVMCMLIGKGVK